ncbi:MAG: PPC domain-containing protein, partial [Planctomycetota bacterium]
GTQQFSVPGVIDTVDLRPFNDPVLGDVFGLEDVTTALAWDVNDDATSSTVTNYLVLAESETSALNPFLQISPGGWNGLTIREGASDRNVVAIREAESVGAVRFATNDNTGLSQFVGELAPDLDSGDENRRLGFVIDGVVSESSDSDVYSFIGEAGSEIWLDIDGTDNSFDSVVELINANGQTLALSDNSIAEEAGTLDIVTANGLDSDAARPMRRNLSPAPRGVITIGEALETAESGFVQLAVDGQSGSAVIPVEDFLADPAGQLQAGLRAVFAGAVGDDVTAQLQRRSGRQLDDAGNLIATGDDYVLNVRFNQDRFRGIAIPQVRIDLSAVVFPATLATPP